jgi:hypothetical protein
VHLVVSHILAIVAIICFALAAPAIVEGASVKRFGWALLTAAFGVILPLAVFFLSAFLTPGSKSGCQNGWFDCFHSGKLWLTPLALWATGALYVREVFAPNPPYQPSLSHGLFMGVLVAGGCSVYGWVWGHLSAGLEATIWLLVPSYLTVWYGIRLLQILECFKPTVREYSLSLLSALPFWIISVLWSRLIFESLPKNPPAMTCFVVTAAARGHPILVGPFVETSRNGHPRCINHQLIALWSLEAKWQQLAPCSHAAFRHVYNRIGPIIARRITSPWLADATYLALKPAEWIARLTVLCLPGGTLHTQQESRYELHKMD